MLSGGILQIKPIANTLTFDKGFFLCFRAIQMLKARAWISSGSTWRLLNSRGCAQRCCVVPDAFA